MSMEDSSKKKNRILPETVTREQAIDTGMAMVLICLLVWYFSHSEKFILLSIGLLLINMIIPQIYKPVAKLWLGLSTLLGTVMSKILLTILFYTIVTPIGFLRRITGNDTLQVRKWQKDKTSVFQVRDHTYQKGDIDKPY